MSHLQHIFLSCGWLLGVLPSLAHADGYGLFSKHEELKNHAVIDAGDVEKIDPPFGKLGASETLKLGANCFQPLGSIDSWGHGKKAGLVMVDRSRTIKLALIESSIGSIKIEAVSVIQVNCPTLGFDGLPQDPQQQLQDLKRRQEFLQRELERRRQQKQ